MGGKTSSSRYDMDAGTHDGGDSWGSLEGAAMDSWQHAFVAFGVPGAWTWRFGDRFFEIHSCDTYSGIARGMDLSHYRGLQLDCVLFLRRPPVLAGVGPRPIHRCFRGMGSLCFSGGDFRGMPHGSSSFVHGLSGG